MKWFYNLKIASKLLIGFIIVAIISGVVGIVGIVNIKKIQSLDVDMYNRHTATMDDLARVLEDYQQSRASLRGLLFVRNDTEKQNEIDKLKIFKNEINTSMEIFEKGINDERVRENFNNLNKALTDFYTYEQKIESLINSNQTDKAITSIYSDGASIANSVQTAGDNLLNLKVQLAKQSADANESTANSATVIMIVVIIIGLILAISLGIFISKIISKPVKKMVDVAEEVASGNLNVQIEATTKDEIGELMTSFGKMTGILLELANEQSKLLEAAAEGDLNARGNKEKFKGGYRDIIEGINNVLDAVIEPVKESAKVLEEVAKGNLNVSVKGNYKGDHAQIKDALNHTIATLASYVGEISEVLNKMADGNMDVDITRDYMGDFVKIKDSLNQIIQAFNNVLNDMNTASSQVASGAQQVSESAQSLSQGSTEQASSIEELTASIEEIAAQTKQNAENANEANELALTAKEDAVRGNEQMRGMLKAMDDINEASGSISKIIKVIDEIAFQTNILALNAAVEAARAGQHGKGFAVVAEEVRNLAARSANAAKETTVLIEGSIKKSEDGTKIANQTAEALNGIVEGVSKAATLVGEIATASNEQAAGIAQINQGIMQVSQVVQSNSATSEESAAASEELSSQAMLLKEMVGKFNLKQTVKAYDTMKELNPDVLRMLERMAEKNSSKFTSMGSSQEKTAVTKTKIVLSDKEFGKY